MAGMIRAATAALAALAAFTAPQLASAQDAVADFYRGRTITLVTPDAAGSGYDAYGRLVGRFIGENIPGKPNVIVQNVPGAGGVIQMNTLYNTSAKDGTVIAIMMHGTLFRPIFDPREVRYKIDGFRWLGSVTAIDVIGAFNKNAPVQKAADLFLNEVLIGGSGGTTVYLPRSVTAVLGTKMKLIGIHVGIPWADEMIAMAWKHKNVYIGSDAHSPAYWPQSFVHFINTYGQDKVIFGTDFPVLDFERTRKEVEALNLRPEAKKKFLRDNAIRIYKLDK